MVGEASCPRCLEMLRELRAKWAEKEHYGGLLGGIWVSFEALTRLFGTSGRLLGASWRLLEAFCRLLGAHGELLGVIRVILGAASRRILVPLGALLAPLGRVLGGSLETLGCLRFATPAEAE